MLRLWWQQPSKQTKSECSALRPDKRGACNMLCSVSAWKKNTNTNTNTNINTNTNTKMRAAGEQRQARKANGLFVFGCLPLFALLSLFLLASFTIFSLSLYCFFLHTVFICSQSEHILHWLPGCPVATCYTNDEYSHTYSQDIHIDKVLSVSRRASLLYETNLERLTEEVESRE